MNTRNSVLISTIVWLCLMAPSVRADSAVLFVLDASGSMWGQIDGQAKIEIARGVMTDLVRTLPADQKVGLMAYGHNRKNDCADIQVVAPLGSSREEIAAAIGKLNPQGMTPLTASLSQAVDLVATAEGGASVVVVSDGKETCEGDPCAAARAAKGRNVDLKVHVVGFDVTKEESEQLQCIAREGGGKYFAAGNASELATAFEEVRAAIEEPPPPPPIAPAVFFQDDFDGEDLAPHWEISNPDPSSYIVEDGHLLVISKSVGGITANDQTPNLLRLDLPMPTGDWTATLEAEADIGQLVWSGGASQIGFGLRDDSTSFILLTMDGFAGSSWSELHLHTVKRAGGQDSEFMTRAWAGNQKDRANLVAGVPHRMTFKLAKQGRSYHSAVHFDGHNDAQGNPVWYESEKVTALRAPVNLALGFGQTKAFAGETLWRIDSLTVESAGE